MQNETDTLPTVNNGMMELIEVIRKQEIEIHKQRTIVAKQIKQLKHQAEVDLLFLNFYWIVFLLVL